MKGCVYISWVKDFFKEDDELDEQIRQLKRIKKKTKDEYSKIKTDKIPDNSKNRNFLGNRFFKLRLNEGLSKLSSKYGLKVNETKYGSKVEKNGKTVFVNIAETYDKDDISIKPTKVKNVYHMTIEKTNWKKALNKFQKGLDK